MSRKCYMLPNRGVSPVVATILLLAIFTVLVAAALSVSQDVLSGGYTQSDSSEAASVCGALAAAINRVGFSFGDAESVGYTFKSSTIAFLPSALEYRIQLSDGDSLSVSTGVLVVATPATHYSFGGNYYQTIYPANGDTPIAPSSGPNSSAIWSIQDENGVDGTEYVFSMLYPLPQLVDTGISVGGQEVWRIYVLRLVGGSTTEPFVKSGYVSVEGLGEQVYSYSGITGFSIQVYSLTSAYPTGFFRATGSNVQLDGVNSGAILQIVVANVSLTGSTV